LAALAITGTVVYFFYEPILKLLQSPLKSPLYYNSPAGSFVFVMKICFTGALAITIPIIIYNIIMFIRPAFEKSISLKRVYLTVCLSILMAMAGTVFAFTCILPGTLRFFNGFQVGGLHALISADSYLNFVTGIIITFILVFQLPLLIALIDSIKPIPPKKMFGMEKWVILGSLIIAALVPFAFDITTCLFIAIPIVVLYNLSIILVAAQHIRTTHRNQSIIRATIVKPESEPTNSPDSTTYFKEILAELKSKPIQAQSHKLTSIDIKPVNRQPEKVQPATWYSNRPKKVTALGKKSNLISEIKR
jgi:sec-independent protein translocase protein TatC